MAVPISQATLLICHLGMRLAPVPANLVAVTVGCIPSYSLNRRWVWGKTGPSHLWREVVPFWAITAAGLALSTLFVAVVSQWTESAVLISAANLTAFGVLWAVKYVVLDNLLFLGD